MNSCLRVVVIASFGLRLYAAEPQINREAEIRMADEMLIKQLRNASPPPKFSNDLPVPELITAKSLGIDVREQERIVSVLGEINARWSESLWDSLVANIGDRSYCITLVDDGVSARNWTAGDICEFLAETQITDCIQCELTIVPAPPTKEHIGYKIDLFDGTSFAVWCGARKHKNYNQLQLELSQTAIDIVLRDRSLDVQHRKLAVASLTRLRNRLQKTVQSQFVRIILFERFSLPR